VWKSVKAKIAKEAADKKKDFDKDDELKQDLKRKAIIAIKNKVSKE